MGPWVGTRLKKSNKTVIQFQNTVLCGSGFSSISSVSVRFSIKTTVSVLISKPSQHYFYKKYNQPLTCLRSANKPTSLQQSSIRLSRRAIKAN